MEKAVAASRGKPRAGLLSAAARRLVACAFFFCAFSLFAAETEMTLSEPPFAAGERLALSFFFYGAQPNAVFFEGEEGSWNAQNSSYYIEESFPPSFLVESVKKSLSFPSRQGVFGGGGGRATIVAIEAIPRQAGEFDIGPFAFMVAGERVTFPPVRIAVESHDGPQAENVELFWLIQSEEGARLTSPAEAQVLDAGRGALIALMAPKTAEGNVACPAPENALLEQADVNPLELAGLLPDDAPSGYAPAACYIWTPLFAGTQALPRAAFSLASGGASFAQEASVEVAAPQAAEISQADEEMLAPALQPPPLPQKPDALYPLDGDSSLEASLASAASALWDAGECAKAAVMLRTAENAFPFRQRIREMRSSLDDALGTEGKSCGAAERALFFAPFALIALALVLFAGIVLYSVFSRKGGEKRKSFFSKKRILAACAILAALGGGCALHSLFSDGMEEAAATGGFLFRVPDEEAAAVAELKDGAPLKIERRAQSWLYAKTLDGAAGWYPSCKIIVCTVRDLHEFW